MKLRRFATHAVAGVLVLMSLWSSPVMAQREPLARRGRASQG